MKILFLCGSVEPGKDGVGDYTRRLAGALVQKGHQAKILSLCDKQANSYVTENQEVEGTTIYVYRIPIVTTYKQRLVWTKSILDTFQPEYISLQYVPYSFNAKGLPLWLSSFLKKLTGNHQWHIMFHELWIGMDTRASFKSRSIGFLQQKIVLKVLKNLGDPSINTQTYLYHQNIANLGYTSKLLPLFSNISEPNIVNTAKVIHNSREICFVLFGGIHFGAPVQVFIDALKIALKKRKGCFLKFVFIGNCGNSITEWTSILDIENIPYEIKGFCTDQEVSKTLLNCSYGINTTPYLLIQKSGSNSAMIQHKLPVICVARAWKVKGFDTDEIQKIPNITYFKNYTSINSFITNGFKLSSEGMIESITNLFLEGL
jgi:hypothetical protein